MRPSIRNSATALVLAAALVPASVATALVPASVATPLVPASVAAPLVPASVATALVPASVATPPVPASVTTPVPASVAAPPVPAAVTAPDRARCARLRRDVSPLVLVQRWETLPAQERRVRLIDELRRRSRLAGREVIEALAPLASGRPRLLWGPGVVCAAAPASAWQAVSRLEQVEAIFDDAPVPDALIDDGAGGPNAAVPPEAPLIALNVPEAWDRGLTGRGVVVALIDTGVDFSHPDLADHLWVNEDEIPGNGIDDDGNGYVDDDRGWNFSAGDNDPSDSSGHGTKVAGLLAGDGSSGRQTGVAPDATLMVLRRGSTESAMWEASQYALDNGAMLISQSASWKWSFTPDYASWRRQAEVELAAGVLRVNSAGNTGQSLDFEPIPYNVAAPGNCPPPWHLPAQSPQAGLSSALAVGNVDARSLAIDPRSATGPSEWTDITAHRDPAYPFPMPAQMQDYPTWDGSPGLGKPDLVAQGENSATTALGGGYTTFGGTSAAAPRVAGIAALLLQAVPSASPAELARALLTTARDLGPAGRDTRYGAGLPDALAAVDTLGPSLEVTLIELIDPGTPRGDGDGGADEGEIDRLRITVRNTSQAVLDDVELILRAGEGVRARDGYALLGSLAPGASRSTPPPHLSVEFLAGSCGTRARIDLELRGGGSSRIEPIFLGVGSETRDELLASDFESPAGFTTGGTASAGGWVRQAPVGTTDGGAPANPAADHSPDPASLAWVTGNGPLDPAAADVDGGQTTLTSPATDARGYGEVELVYHRWFYGADAAGEDRFRVEASGDGALWQLVEEITATENVWRRRRVTLSDLLTPGLSTLVRFVAEDAGGEDIVEGGVDDFTLTGIALDCLPWSLPNDSPGAVGASLRLAKSPRGHAELSWDPPSAAGGADPARGYSITRSADPSGAFAEIGQAATERFVDVDAAAPTDQAVLFWLVESISPLP